MDASGGAPGGMSDDQVLSEAMDVFDQSMGMPGQAGAESSGMPADTYGDSDVLGQTAGNTKPGTPSGSDASGHDQAAGMDIPQQAGAGESGGEYSASDEIGASGSGGFGQETAAGGEDAGAGGAMGAGQTAYDAQGSGGMGQDESYGSAGYPAGSGGAQGQAGATGGYPGSPGYGGQQGSGGGAMTHAERVGVLEGQLDEQLAVFDGMILGEQRTVISERDENAGQSGGYGYGGSGDGEGPGGAGNGTGQGDTAPLLTAMGRGSTNSNAGGGMMPDLPEDNRKGEFGAGSQQSNIPADIPDGSDDDVVARQLREAAMKETDPALREKLWDEYRKYKKGVALKR